MGASIFLNIYIYVCIYIYIIYIIYIYNRTRMGGSIFLSLVRFVACSACTGILLSLSLSLSLSLLIPYARERGRERGGGYSLLGIKRFVSLGKHIVGSDVC
jgi:hypothetical protein